MLEPSRTAVAALILLVGIPNPSLIDRILGRKAAPRRAFPAQPAALVAGLDALVATKDWRALPYVGWLFETEATPEPVLAAISQLMPRDEASLEALPALGDEPRVQATLRYVL